MGSFPVKGIGVVIVLYSLPAETAGEGARMGNVNNVYVDMSGLIEDMFSKLRDGIFNDPSLTEEQREKITDIIDKHEPCYDVGLIVNVDESCYSDYSTRVDVSIGDIEKSEEIKEDSYTKKAYPDYGVFFSQTYQG